MRPRTLVVGSVLLLSVGVNLGVLAIVARERARPVPAPEGPRLEVAPPGASRAELPPGPAPGPIAPPEATIEPRPVVAGPPPAAVLSPPAPVRPERPAPEAKPLFAEPADPPRQDPLRGEELGLDDPPPLTETPPQEMPPPARQRLEELADRVQLEGERRDQFFAVQRRLFFELWNGRQETRRAEMRLRHELASPEPDRDRLEILLQRLESARSRQDRAVVTAVLATRELLGPAEERLYVQFIGRLRAAAVNNGREGRPAGPQPGAQGERRRRLHQQRPPGF